MKHVPMDQHERLNDLLRKPESAEFVNRDWRLDDDIRTVQKIGNAASHDGAEPIKRVKAFRCLRSLYNVVQGFMYRWEAIKDPLVPFYGVRPVIYYTNGYQTMVIDGLGYQ